MAQEEISSTSPFFLRKILLICLFVFHWNRCTSFKFGICFEQLSGNCVAESLNWCRDQRARPFKMKILRQKQKACWGTVSEMRKMKHLSSRCLTVRQQYLKPHATPILLWKQLADNNLLKQTGTKNVYSGCSLTVLFSTTQPAKSFLTLKKSSKSMSVWLQLIFHFNPEKGRNS